MSGPVGLHGGGEYLAGDEPFLDALLAAAARMARVRAAAADDDQDVSGHGGPAGTMEPLRVSILPTAAARGLPDRAAANGVEAFERRAAAAGVPVRVEVARVVDRASASDPAIAGQLAGSDLIHLPGGDPDLVPSILADTPALEAIRSAWQRGAVVAGASAGAMALAEWTWTPKGGMHGLGFVLGLAVVPHYDDIRRTTWQQVIDALAPGGIGYLGLDERTGVLAEANGDGERTWTVAGPGAAWWFARGKREPLVARSGERLRLPS
ncbi:MAG TPA: Type 1 glutamine amidotransferase-like domain-containing protein [Candidatus Limnocylindrales bacterium]|jgi:cyanophycinase